jgi:hypothetical protein
VSEHRNRLSAFAAVHEWLSGDKIYAGHETSFPTVFEPDPLSNSGQELSGFDTPVGGGLGFTMEGVRRLRLLA